MVMMKNTLFFKVPADTEIYTVCTPGGITIKGLNEMTKEGFDHAVIAGLMKAAGK